MIDGRAEERHSDNMVSLGHEAVIPTDKCSNDGVPAPLSSSIVAMAADSNCNTIV